MSCVQTYTPAAGAVRRPKKANPALLRLVAEKVRRFALLDPEASASSDRATAQLSLLDSVKMGRS